MAEKDKDELSFEEAINSLSEIVGKIESGDVPLQDSLEQYERGMKLIKQCRGILQEAEARIEKIAAESKGTDQED